VVHTTHYHISTIRCPIATSHNPSPDAHQASRITRHSTRFATTRPPIAHHQRRPPLSPSPPPLLLHFFYTAPFSYSPSHAPPLVPSYAMPLHPIHVRSLNIFPSPLLYTPPHSMEKQPHSARHHLLPDVRIHSSPTPTYPYTHPSPRPLFPRRNHHFVFVTHHAPPIYMIHSHPAHYPLPDRRSTPTHHLIYRVLHTAHYLSLIPQHSSPSHAQHYAPNHTLWPTVTHHAPIHSLTVTHH